MRESPRVAPLGPRGFSYDHLGQRNTGPGVKQKSPYHPLEERGMGVSGTPGRRRWKEGRGGESRRVEGLYERRSSSEVRVSEGRRALLCAWS